MKNLLKKLMSAEFFRYVITGGTTTLIDLLFYYIFCRILGMDATVSNICSISISMVYSYIANKLVVFRTHCENLKALGREIVRFFSSRIGGMALEIGCVFLLCNIMGMEGFLGKLLTQVIIFAFNYLASKFWAFKS